MAVWSENSRDAEEISQIHFEMERFFSAHNFLETMEKEKDHQKTEALSLIVLRTLSCVS